MTRFLLSLWLVLGVSTLKGAPSHPRKVVSKPLPLILWYNTPARFFEEALPIGNGKLGAMVYGGEEVDSLLLNDITLWSGQPVNPHEDSEAHQWIPRIREALFREDYAAADSLQLHVQGHNSAYYMPLGTLYLKDQNIRHKMSDYRRELSLDSAICRVSYRRGDCQFVREYVASHPDKCIAIHLRSLKPGQLFQAVSLQSPLQHTTTASGSQLTMLGHATGDAKASTHFCTIVRATAQDGHMYVANGRLIIDGATEATLYVVNETSFNGYNHHPVDEGAPYMDIAADDIWHTVNIDYAGLRQRHVTDYRHFFSRFNLQLGDAQPDHHRTTEEQLRAYTDQQEANPYLETLYLQYGRYLLISSSRTPGVPATLQGLWNPHLQAPWRSNYTMNINLEENYWPAEVANLSEMAMPLWGFMQALADNGHHASRNYYGINEGWSASHNSDIWAMANPVGEKRESPEWSNWNMGGAWLSQAAWEHFTFTQDTVFLRQQAYPLLKGASAFMTHWLLPHPQHPDELITAPSTSPENEYKTPQGYHGTTCYGGTADLAIIRELFGNTLQAHRLLVPNPAATPSTSDTTISTVARQLRQLHPYTIGHMGDINEWYHDWDDWDFQHRHQSHLIGVFPGHQITPETTPQLAQAAIRSLEIKGDETTGWSTGWRINLWARLHRADKAYQLLRKLLSYVTPDGYKGPDRRQHGGTYPNLFDAHPPFQIDGNFGGTAGICEMLVQSRYNPEPTSRPANGARAAVEIDLLPALPTAWPSGHVSGLCARGGIEVTIHWQQGRVSQAILTNRHGYRGPILVRYNGQERLIRLRPGQSKTLK